MHYITMVNLTTLNTRIQDIFVHYREGCNVRNPMIWILRSLTSPTNLVMVWFTIQSVYNVGLGLSNFNWSYFIMIFMPNSPFNRTSSTMFLPTWTYITVMWRSITTKTIIRLGPITMIFFLPRAIFITTYCFKFGAILKS
jgi:hypothetical protein